MPVAGVIPQYRKRVLNRRAVEMSGAISKEQCDLLENDALDVLREVRDAIIVALDTDNPATMFCPRLIDRLVHANAVMALYADPESLAYYRGMICPEVENIPPSHRPQLGDFSHALWVGDGTIQTT